VERRPHGVRRRWRGMRECLGIAAATQHTWGRPITTLPAGQSVSRP
jgi:hypothetical protein